MTKSRLLKLTDQDERMLKANAKRRGFDTVSAYIRFLIRNDARKVKK